MNKVTPKQVAEFMKKRLEKEKYLYQEIVVYEIEEKFGERFTYANQRGNLAIAREVLAEFRKITPNVVWDRVERCWRNRSKFDDPKKRQQES